MKSRLQLAQGSLIEPTSLFHSSALSHATTAEARTPYPEHLPRIDGHSMMFSMVRDNWRLTLAVCVALGGITLALFWPVRNHEFIVFDDGQYVFENPHVASGLTWPNVVWAVTQFHSGNWHPMTWISHMLDVQLFGMKPGMHHLTNVFFHSANALLLFLLLKRMTSALWQSAAVAGFFALHPAHVESVAWVAERKDVLSTCFGLLTLLAYVTYVSRAEFQAQKKLETRNSKSETTAKPTGATHPALAQTVASSPAFFYFLGLFFFALGLMSKPMLVTLPFLMLLIDYWPLNRVSKLGGPTRAVLKQLLLEKVPFLCLTIASCVITFSAQNVGGAVDTLERVPIEARLSNAVIAYVDYLQELVWPSKLAILYLRPEHWPAMRVTLSLVMLCGLTLLAIFGSRRRPWFAVGWFWFLGILVPVIGIVQVGNQYMADRYTYIPYIGLFILMIWGAWETAKNSVIWRPLVIASAFILLGFAGLQTHRQLRYWKNNETLFGHCIAVTKNNFSAHNILGVAMARQNRFAEARYHFDESLRIRPGYLDALQNLGILLTDHGDFDEAITCLRRAVGLRPELAMLFSKLGLALDMKDLPEEAANYYRECLRSMPNQEDACNNLAWLLATYPEARFRNGAEAVRLAEGICAATGYQKPALIGTLAAAYAEAGRFSEASATAEKAIQVATATGESEIVARNKQLLELYRAGKPYREPRNKSAPTQ